MRDQQLCHLLTRACSGSRLDEQSSFNFDVVEFLQDNLEHCRDTAQFILKRIVRGSSKSALLAISLLDVCVINVGYPFQLQVASKDFLKRLVSRFPECAPLVPTSVMNSILFLLVKWNISFVSYYLNWDGIESKSGHFRYYYEDFENIDRVCKLLALRGYTFPMISEDSVRVLMPFKNNFPISKKEYEKEVELIQQFRLAELLKSSNEGDLVKANELIRDITGYENNDHWKYHVHFRRILNAIRQDLSCSSQIIVGSNEYKHYQMIFHQLQTLVHQEQDEEFPKGETLGLLDALGSKLSLPFKSRVLKSQIMHELMELDFM